MTGQQHQPLLFFVTAPAVFVFIFCTRHGILYGCAIIYRVPRRLERALWLLTYLEWDPRAFFWLELTIEDTRIVYNGFQSVSYCIIVCIRFCHHDNVRESHCFGPRDDVWKEKEQKDRLQQVSGSFVLCPVLCGYMLHRGGPAVGTQRYLRHSWRLWVKM